MYFDLNVAWVTQMSELKQTLDILSEFGYNVVALSHTLTGKLPADLSCPIPTKLPFEVPPRLEILRRCTLVTSDPHQNFRIPTLASNYDILAVRPTNTRSLEQACQSLDCDIISLDLTQRFDSHFKMKTLAAAVERGIKFEISYSPPISTSDHHARRNFIGNATQLIRATRSRGLIISSGASNAVFCRGPADVINMAAVWGLGPEKGKEAIDKMSRNLVVSSQLKRTSYRGAIDIVGGGEVAGKDQTNKTLSANLSNKRKAQEAEEKGKSTILPISKREQKRRRKEALAEQNKDSGKHL